jgi:CRISPR-associated protein Cmr4
MDAKLLFLHALSSLHAGVGQGVGVIDQPIAREKATGIPYIPGSSLKGVFRDACEDTDACIRVFGPDTGNADSHAGSLQLTDARLLFLPVRSLQGVFAWVTAPFVLQRYVRDLAVTKYSVPGDIPGPKDQECLISDEETIISLQMDEKAAVIIEDLKIPAAASPEVSAWGRNIGKALFPDNEGWQKAFQARMCVVPDDVFSFLLETATEVTAHIRLESEKKSVEEGALWYEETLPAETILYGLAVASPIKASKTEVFETIKKVAENTLQFGGNATVGQGLCSVKVWEEGS